MRPKAVARPKLRRSPLPPQSANALTQSILTFLRANRFKCWRNNSGTMLGRWKYGEVGSADIFALREGKFYAIEVKAAKDVLSETQLNWLNDARQHGAITIIARSLDDVTAVIK